MAEGRVGVDGADRRRKTVPHVWTADRESPSSELGPSSLYRSCSGRSGAELPMKKKKKKKILIGNKNNPMGHTG